jgi:hypothetical protein
VSAIICDAGLSLAALTDRGKHHASALDHRRCRPLPRVIANASNCWPRELSPAWQRVRSVRGGWAGHRVRAKRGRRRRQPEGRSGQPQAFKSVERPSPGEDAERGWEGGRTQPQPAHPSRTTPRFQRHGTCPEQRDTPPQHLPRRTPQSPTGTHRQRPPSQTGSDPELSRSTRHSTLTLPAQAPLTRREVRRCLIAPTRDLLGRLDQMRAYQGSVSCWIGQRLAVPGGSTGSSLGGQSCGTAPRRADCRRPPVGRAVFCRPR